MASRKTLKKSVKSIAQELLSDLVALSLTGDADRERLAALAARTVAMEKDFVARISHAEPGNVPYFFKKLRADFEREANAVAAEIVTL
ncbi:MAG: hypothetical protein J6M53_09275 [Bacteroidaceae bacterium]|nr:hypothetical protein [Bacteroidaceae bacterium]